MTAAPTLTTGTCPVHKKPLALVPDKDLSREARWCGTWYRCLLCRHSLLVPSSELTAQNARLAEVTP